MLKLCLSNQARPWRPLSRITRPRAPGARFVYASYLGPIAFGPLRRLLRSEVEAPGQPSGGLLPVQGVLRQDPDHGPDAHLPAGLKARLPPGLLRPPGCAPVVERLARGLLQQLSHGTAPSLFLHYSPIRKRGQGRLADGLGQGNVPALHRDVGRFPPPGHGEDRGWKAHTTSGPGPRCL